MPEIVSVQEAFNTFDADASGTIDFEELGALLESQARTALGLSLKLALAARSPQPLPMQGIFPLQHAIYELAMAAAPVVNKNRAMLRTRTLAIVLRMKAQQKCRRQQPTKTHNHPALGWLRRGRGAGT